MSGGCLAAGGSTSFLGCICTLEPAFTEQLHRARIHNRCWSIASPSAGKQFSLLSTSEDATGRLAALLAAEMRAGDAYCLKGDQGGGKTTFRQAALACPCRLCWRTLCCSRAWVTEGQTRWLKVQQPPGFARALYHIPFKNPLRK